MQSVTDFFLCPPFLPEISSFESDIEYFAKFRHPGTRLWLFDDFDRWFSDPGDSRAYVLLGDAGVGKTVIAAALAKRALERKSFGACYFCLHKDTLRSDPRNLIGTVAYQLCEYNEEYRTNVGGRSRVTTILANSALGLIELFTKLLQEPLGKCNTHSKRMLVIIDALDETNHESRKDFFYVLRDRFPLLPKWLVFFITSRPEETVKFNLQRYNPCIKICAGNDQDDDYYRQHEEDMRQFLMKQVNFSELPYTVEEVVAKCNGMFLYARYISQELNDRTSAIKGVNLDDLFPGDIERFFLNNFDRIFEKLGKGLYEKLFSCVIAAPAPLPFPFISFILEKENSSLKKKTVIDAVSRFVVVRKSDSTFWFLHSLIPLWLTNEEKAQELFIDRGKASEYFKEIILTFLPRAFSDQLERGVSINRDVRNYLLRVGVRFLCCNYDNRDSMTTVFSCLTSFHFLQKRVNTDRLEIFSVVSDYKLCLKCHHLAEADKKILQEIYTALEENIHVLVESPHLLPSCLQCTSEATLKKFAVDTSMEYKSFNWFPYFAPTVSCENGYLVLSPDKKLLAEANPDGGIVRMYDACSLKEVLGPVDCYMTLDYLSSDEKFLLLRMKGNALSVEGGRAGKIPSPYRKIRVTGTHAKACLAYAFSLWAKLELSQNKDCHSEVFRSRKVLCLLGVAEDCLRDELRHDSSWTALPPNSAFWRGKSLNDLQVELDAYLNGTKDAKSLCRDCLRYYAQEPSLTDVIEWIAGMYKWDCFLQQCISFSDLFYVIISSFMKASRELPLAPAELLDLTFDNRVQSSPNGKLIAVLAPRFPKHVHGRHQKGILQVLMNRTETGETKFRVPVHIIEHVLSFAFTLSSDFVVYVPEGGKCFQALSLQTGATLSCVSGFSPLFHIPTQQVGFVFSAGSDESIVLLSDFPISSSLGKYLKIPQLSSFGAPSGVTFTLQGNILSLFSNSMLYVLKRNGDALFALNCALLTYPCDVTPLACVENCALSRQRNSVAISQKASIFIFDNYEFHCTVFEESEDIGCQVSCLVFSHDSTLLLYCVERRKRNAQLCLWNVDQNKPSSSFFASTLEFINCCCLSPDNSIVILCGELRVEIWEDVLCSCPRLKVFIEMDEIWPYQANDRFHCCSVSSRNELLACCIAGDVVLCSPSSSTRRESFRCLPQAHLGLIQFCQFLKGTRYLISYGIDGRVFLWDLYDGKAAAFAKVAKKGESIEGMSVSRMEDEVVCLLSSGRVITIKLRGLKSATIPSQMLLSDAIESSLILGCPYVALRPAIEKFQSKLWSRKEFFDETGSDELNEDINIFMPSDTSGDESDYEETQK